MATPAVPAAAIDGDHVLELTRSYDAPREAVFAAWTDPALLGRWLGPGGIRAEVKEMDARPGGAYRIAMHGGPSGMNLVRGIYREVVAPERIVFTWSWEADAERAGLAQESVVTVTLRSIGKRTEMTLRHERFASRDARDRHNQGWTGSLDKLAGVLAGTTAGA